MSLRNPRARLASVVLCAMLIGMALLGGSWPSTRAAERTSATSASPLVVNPWTVKYASLDGRVGCAGSWALDVYTLRYEQLASRAFELHFDSAKFITVAGESPMCSRHIHALETGSFTGWVKFRIVGGNLNPDTTCKKIDSCAGDTIAQGIDHFARLTFGNAASAVIGDACSAYSGGDHDNDAGDLLQVATTGVSCSVLGTGNQGDIFQ